MFKKILIFIISVGIILGLIFFGKFLIERRNLKKQITSLDRQMIFDLPEFKEAQKKFEQDSIDLQNFYIQEGKKLNPEKKQNLTMQIQQQLMQKRALLLNPLLQKIEAAIAITAKEKKISVVLDKKIAVYGISEITEDVIKKFKSQKELNLPEKENTQKSTIGYFDQEAVRSLKIFQEADQKLMKTFQGMQEELNKKGGEKLSPEEQNKLKEEYNYKLYQKRNEIYSSLFANVTKAVEKVAREENLSLVLDKQNVMYGGKNITDKVINLFLKENK